MKAPSSSGARFAVVAVLIAFVVLLGFVLTSSNAGHKLSTTLPNARYMVKGTQVRAAGTVVGKITKAEATRDGRAHVEMEISDDKVWPLPRNTVFNMRWNGTITYAGRYVDMQIPSRSKSSAAHYHDGDTIPAKDVVTKVEADDLFNTLDPKTQGDLKDTLQKTGGALDGSQKNLRGALQKAPPALDRARKVVGDLGYSPDDLDTLVGSTDRVVHAVRVSDPGVGELVQGLSRTFHATASESNQLRETLAQGPSTLLTARRGLAHADYTLGQLGDVTTRLRPGVQELRRTVDPLNGTLVTLKDVGPSARSTLRTARIATKDLNPLLVSARRLVPTLGSVGRVAAKQLDCVRPYAPEVAGISQTWSRFLRLEDNQDKFARANLPPTTFDQTPLSSKQIKQIFPQYRYAFPIPPGNSSAQPWYQPQCHLGPETNDVSKDPEIGTP